MFKIIQEEIRLLVRQAYLVGKLEERHLTSTLLNKSDKTDEVRDELNSIYPSYLELLEKYTTTK
jgi:hypothetical protein